MEAMLIIGVILLAVAAGCFWGYRSSKGKLDEVLSVQTSKIAELKEAAAAVAEGVGAGNFSQYAEIKGQMECPDVLTSELGKRECVYYRSSVTREWEEEDWVTDSEGKRERRTNRGSDTMSSNEEAVAFFINDGSGKLRVEPRRADLELVQTVDRFEPANRVSLGSGTLSFGGISFNIGSFDFGSNHRKTLGYRFKEHIFPPRGAVYALGQVHDQLGDLTMEKPNEKGQRFILTHKSEDALIADTQKQSNLFKIGAISSAVLGVVLTLVGLVVK